METNTLITVVVGVVMATGIVFGVARICSGNHPYPPMCVVSVSFVVGVQGVCVSENTEYTLISRTNDKPSHKQTHCDELIYISTQQLARSSGKKSIL